MRHNNVSDLNADLQKEVCRDITVELQDAPGVSKTVKKGEGYKAQS